MPLPANFGLAVVKDVFSRHGIHILHDYGDGQIMWGNEPLVEPYKGEFHIADAYTPGRWDIFTIRGILSKLDKAGVQQEIERELFNRINEGVE
jgi:hypothetical protein